MESILNCATALCRMVKTSVQRGRGEPRGEGYSALYVEPLSEARTTLTGVFSILLVGVTIETDTKLHRALFAATAAAGTGNLRFPVRLFIIETTDCLAAFGNRSPRFLGSWCIGHETAFGNRYLALLRGVSLGHTETAGLLGRCRKIEWNLGHSPSRVRQHGTQQQERADEERHECRHAPDSTTGFVLAATLKSA